MTDYDHLIKLKAAADPLRVAGNIDRIPFEEQREKGPANRPLLDYLEGWKEKR
jgi:hypothetical protein